MGRRKKHIVVEQRQSDDLIPGLPDEIAKLCIARVPRAYHHNARSVSRGWRNFVHGRAFLELRRELLVVEEWLYVWIKAGNVWRCFDPSLQKWFRLPKLPRDDKRIVGSSAFVSFDGKLFVIGGWNLKSWEKDQSYVPCKTVSYFDPGSGSWKRAANLKEARAECMVGVIDNQLFVCGGYIKGFRTSTTEIYDAQSDSWKRDYNASYLLSQMGNFRATSDSVAKFGPMGDSVVMDNKFYVQSLRFDFNGLVYDAQTDKWEPMTDGLARAWDYRLNNTVTVLNGKLYTIIGHVTGNPELAGIPEQGQPVRVYNPDNDVWEVVRDIDRTFWDLMSAMSMCENEKFKTVHLINLSGKLCVVYIVDSLLGLEATEIRIGLVEAERFSEIQRCFARFKHDEEDDFQAFLHPEPVSRLIKTCQVVPL